MGVLGKALLLAPLQVSDAEAGQETRLSAGQPIRVGDLDYQAATGRNATALSARFVVSERTCSAHSTSAVRFSAA